MTSFLLDTNIPSELTKSQSSPQVEHWPESVDNESLYLSVITLAEIMRGITRLPASKRRDSLQQWLDGALRAWFQDRMLPITQPIAERLGVLAGERDRQGFHLAVADGLIAATALEHGLTLATRNVKDLAGLGLTLLNPWEPMDA